MLVRRLEPPDRGRMEDPAWLAAAGLRFSEHKGHSGGPRRLSGGIRRHEPHTSIKEQCDVNTLVDLNRCVRVAQVVMNRWFLSISTTAGVVLATLATYLMIEQNRFAMAGLFLFFAFCLPLYPESMRDKLLKRNSKMGSDDDKP